MSYATTILADTPTGYWPLDEVAGTTAVDASGNGLDGTYEGTPSLNSRTIELFTCPDFDGTDDLVRIPGVTALMATAATFEAWVIRDVSNAGAGIVTDEYLGAVIFLELGQDPLSVVGASAEHFEAGEYNGLGWTIATAPATIVDATRYLVHATHDGATVTLYVNAVAVASASVAFVASITDILIGRRHDISNVPFWNGAIAQVAIYDYALTPTQISDHMLAGQAPPAPVDYGDNGDEAPPATQTAPDALATSPAPRFGAEVPGIGYGADDQYRST